MKKLIDVVPQWRTNGIFNYLNEFNIPWDETLSTQLDLEYFGNLSGDKNISPLVDKILGTDSILTNGNMEVLASVAYSLHGDNWRKQWATTQLIYDPISNYDMSERLTNDTHVTQYGKTETRTNNLAHGKTGTETESPNITETRTDNLSHEKTGTETETPNTTQTTTPNLINIETDTINGFNSSVGVESNGRNLTATGTNTTTNTGNVETEYDVTDTDTGTQTIARTGQTQIRFDLMDTDTGTQTNASTGTDSTTRNYVLTRTGNIGVTTTQQMIEQERKLLLWNFFYAVVFPDIDGVLTIQVY